MSDFDFLKEFGKNLDRERPNEVPNDADWRDLESRLDARDLQQNRRRRFGAGLLPLFVAVGFAWLGAAFWQSARRADVLKIEVENMKTMLAEREKTDSVLQKITVVQFDTIFKIVVIRREVREELAGLNFSKNENDGAAGNFLDKKSAQNPTQNLAENRNQNFSKNENSGAAANFLDKKSVENSTQNFGENPSQNFSKNETDGAAANFSKNENAPILNKNQPKSIENQSNLSDFSTKTGDSSAIATTGFLSKKWAEPLESLPKPTPKPLVFHRKNHLPAPDLVMSPAPPASKKEQIVRRFRMQDFELGVRGGLLFPETKRAAAGRSFSMGMTAEKAFAPRLRMTAGADFGRMFFGVKPDDLAQSNLPKPTPPTPDDVLEKVKVEQPVLDFLLGLRFDFLPEKRLRPFVSAAWVGEQVREQLIRYEFKNEVTDEETHLRIPRNDQHFNARGVQIGLGADWFFVRRWSVGAAGFYQRQFDSKTPFLARRAGVRAGVNFRF